MEVYDYDRGGYIDLNTWVAGIDGWDMHIAGIVV